MPLPIPQLAPPEAGYVLLPMPLQQAQPLLRSLSQQGLAPMSSRLDSERQRAARRSRVLLPGCRKLSRCVLVPRR
jgi:hypothetical protein